MKIKPEHFTAIDAAIRDLYAKHSEKLAAHRVAIENDPRAKDKAMRYRWDLLHATGLRITNAHNIEPGANALPLYDYMDDSHIDTALKAIINKIEKE